MLWKWNVPLDYIHVKESISQQLAGNPKPNTHGYQQSHTPSKRVLEFNQENFKQHIKHGKAMDTPCSFGYSYHVTSNHPPQVYNHQPSCSACFDDSDGVLQESSSNPRPEGSQTLPLVLHEERVCWRGMATQFRHTTYKTTQYDLPSISWVKINVGYMVVAEFVV